MDWRLQNPGNQEKAKREVRYEFFPFLSMRILYPQDFLPDDKEKYLERILADQSYGSRINRTFCREYPIHLSGPKLG